MTTFPLTLNGLELDGYCNTISQTLDDLLHHIGEHPSNHPSGRAFDPLTIPSPVQREGFLLMRDLLQWAESLAGQLRYDVGVVHHDCPEHDDWMEKKIARCRFGVGRTDHEHLRPRRKGEDMTTIDVTPDWEGMRRWIRVVARTDLALALEINAAMGCEGIPEDELRGTA